MSNIISIIRDNAGWLFGGTGAAGVILTLFKLLAKSQNGGSANNTTLIVKGPVGGDVVGRDKNVATGPSLMTIVIIFLLVSSVVFCMIWLLPASSKSSVSIIGDGNAVVNGPNGSATSNVKKY